MGITHDVANAIATKLASVPGMVGAAAAGTDTVPDTPYAVLGAARGTIDPASWETEEISYPLLVFIGRVVSADDSLTSAYDLKDAIQTVLRTGVQLGLGASGVTQALLVDWDTDQYYDVGGQAYQALAGTVRVTLARGMAWTP